MCVCVCVPEMAICWILNWMLMVGFSSGLEAPACRLIVPFRLGSFCGLILPTSQDNNWAQKKKRGWCDRTSSWAKGCTWKKDIKAVSLGLPLWLGQKCMFPVRGWGWRWGLLWAAGCWLTPILQPCPLFVLVPVSSQSVPGSFPL